MKIASFVWGMYEARLYPGIGKSSTHNLPTLTDLMQNLFGKNKLAIFDRFLKNVLIFEIKGGCSRSEHPVGFAPTPKVLGLRFVWLLWYKKPPTELHVYHRFLQSVVYFTLVFALKLPDDALNSYMYLVETWKEHFAS